MYYGLHSFTEKEFEGKKYNQILRSAFIISSKYVRINNSMIDELGSQAVSPISAYIWEEKFKLKPTNPKKRVVNGEVFFKIVGQRQYPLLNKLNSVERKKVYDNLRETGIAKEDLQTDNEIIDYFKTKVNDDLIETKQLVRWRDWNYGVTWNPISKMNYMATYSDELVKNAWEKLIILLTETIGNCKKDDDNIKIASDGLELKYKSNI